jgi:hypothetical protein
VWWTLAGGAIAGFGAALAVHFGVGYVDFWHVAPIYAGILVTTIGLALSWQFLVAPSRLPRGLGKPSESVSSAGRRW